jgi:ABC-type oligopeptide transport system substrate-binding subunit
VQEVITRRLPVALAILVTGTALLGAAALVSSAAEAPKGGTLRIISPDDLSVDPALAYLTDDWMVEYATCAKLFNQPDLPGAAGLRVVPEVVRSFTVSRDGRTYTFVLRETFRFHTGARVTAQSYAEAFNRNAQPTLRSPATKYMHEIAGADAVIDGKAKSISGVRVLGRYRLQVRLTRPLGDFTARLTMPFFCPILPNTPVDPEGMDNPAGSGPYYVAERVVNQRTVLRRNRFYRGDRPANVDEIVWTGGVSIQTCELAVAEDRADFCGEPGAPRSAYRGLAEAYGINRPGGQLFVRPSPATWMFVFNHDRPAFEGAGQIPLKKAINFAIDRPELTRAAGYLGGKRTDQLLPPALGRPASIYPLTGADPVAARRWYARAKHKPTTLVLYGSSSGPPRVAMAQVLAYNLKQIGIDVEVKFFDTDSLARKATTPGEPYDLLQLGWGADFADGAGFMVALLAGGGVNLNDPALERRIDAANRHTGEARRRAWADLDVDLMRNNPPRAPYVQLPRRLFVSRSTGCVLIHPVYGFDIAAACKK